MIAVLWNRNERDVHFSIDGLDIQLRPNQLVTNTYLQYVSYNVNEAPLTAFLFNR